MSFLCDFLFLQILTVYLSRIYAYILVYGTSIYQSNLKSFWKAVGDIKLVGLVDGRPSHKRGRHPLTITTGTRYPYHQIGSAVV